MLQILIGLSLFLILKVNSLESETCEAIVPVDTTAKLGEKAILKCRLSSQNIAWTFCPRNGKPRLIASSCNLAQSASSSYSLDQTSNACNLVIANVTASHLGSYTCQDMSLNDEGHTVQLGNTNENLALNKNTIQSSTFLEPSLAPTPRSSNFAVDGNLDSNSLHGSCAHTLLDSPGWWAVDLGQEMSVGRVRIIGRSECCRNELQNFFISLTNVSPWVTAPSTLNQTNICKFFVGQPPTKIPLDIFCEPNAASGRYLYVLANQADYLSICELEAYYN